MCGDIRIQTYFAFTAAKGDSGKLRNEKLHDLCYSSNIISFIKSRKIRREERVARKGDMNNILVGGPGQISRRRWKDNIKVDLKKVR
jgi:hypothetical protein